MFESALLLVCGLELPEKHAYLLPASWAFDLPSSLAFYVLDDALR